MGSTMRWTAALAAAAAVAGGAATLPPGRASTAAVGTAKLNPAWSARRAYAYMGRTPDRRYTRFGLRCAAWWGGWVRDRDPYFKRYGGKRATWEVELCWKAS